MSPIVSNTASRERKYTRPIGGVPLSGYFVPMRIVVVMFEYRNGRPCSTVALVMLQDEAFGDVYLVNCTTALRAP